MKNEITVSFKITPSKPIRKSLRKNMARNINVMPPKQMTWNPIGLYWESCDTADMIPRSRNVYPLTVSQDRTRSLLNNLGHCLENCTGFRSGVDHTTISANLTTSNSKPLYSFYNLMTYRHYIILY